MRREQAGTIMSGDFGPRSDLARVRAVSDDGRRLYLEYRNGQIATVDGEKAFRPSGHKRLIDSISWPMVVTAMDKVLLR